MRLRFPISAERATLFALVGISIALFLYVAVRSVVVAFTFDEAWSQLLLENSWSDILWCRPPNSNNHVGNTLLMKLCASLFGEEPWSLRLPNVLAFALYLRWGTGVARRLDRPFWVMLAFLLLAFQPWVLDFFALARGYGLAMAMVMGALHHLLAFREAPRMWHLSWGAVLSGLAVTFNFAFLHLFLAISAATLTLVLTHAIRAGGTWGQRLRFTGKSLLPLAGISVLLLLYLPGPIRGLIDAKEFYFGGNTGFWDDTVFTLGHGLLYKVDYWKHDLWLLLKVAAALLVAMGITASVVWARRGFRFLDSPLMLIAILLFVPWLGITLQHQWMGSLFPIYRTGMYLVPLFCLGVAWMLREWAKVKVGRIGAYILSGSLLLPLTLHNAHTLNFTHTAEWQVDADTPTALRDLERDFKASGIASPITIGCSWPLRSAINYYLILWKWDWLLPTDTKGCQPGHTYYMVWEDGRECNLPPEQLPFGKDGGYRKIGYYPVSGVTLWGIER